MNDTSTYVYKVLGTGILAYDGSSTVLTTGSTTALYRVAYGRMDHNSRTGESYPCP